MIPTPTGLGPPTRVQPRRPPARGTTTGLPGDTHLGQDTPNAASTRADAVPKPPAHRARTRRPATPLPPPHRRLRSDPACLLPHRAPAACPPAAAGHPTDHPGRPRRRRQRLQSKPPLPLRVSFPPYRPQPGLDPARKAALIGVPSTSTPAGGHRTETTMAARKTTQAVQALEDHTDHDQPCHLANTLALISIAQSLDTLREQAAVIADQLTNLAHLRRDGR